MALPFVQVLSFLSRFPDSFGETLLNVKLFLPDMLKVKLQNKVCLFWIA